MKKIGTLYKWLFILMIIAQTACAIYFCTTKVGMHYDENYSYYSSNATYGLSVPDREWKDGLEIISEFRVNKGEAFDYGRVKQMQSFDVHPPMYYYVLHTVCSLTPGVYSKWQGLWINVFFYLVSIALLGLIAGKLAPDKPLIALLTLALFGFSPAIISCITFIRMYMMLNALTLLIIWLHVRVLTGSRISVKGFYLPVFAVTWIGFMTHYYFAVFMFFTAAFMCLYLFIHKESRKQSFIYGGTVVGAMLLGVAYYPVCLSHIFRGYRGQDAINAFVDAGNLKERAGLFIGLLQEYLLCDTFYISLLVIVLLYVTSTLRRKEHAKLSPAMGLLLTVIAGYFAVVMKTALTNAEEAIRYELPSYGLIILCIVYGMYDLTTLVCDRLYTGKNAKSLKQAAIHGITGVLAIMLICQIGGLCSDKVLFTYPETGASIDWAKEHRNDCILYIYNPNNSWMIWNDAEELMVYDKIFFISSDTTEPVTDREVTEGDSIYVYAMRGENADAVLEQTLRDCVRHKRAVKIRELGYADLYEFR
ncbi:MAG: glycosyltransferase family 39 protein [Lachnospiraceae bacterium]|nr:glycosyltransferase family 39 protein [Lachnospiraceae bacterium]